MRINTVFVDHLKVLDTKPCDLLNGNNTHTFDKESK